MLFIQIKRLVVTCLLHVQSVSTLNASSALSNASPALLSPVLYSQEE